MTRIFLLAIALVAMSCAQEPSHNFDNAEFVKVEMNFAKGLRIWKRGEDYRVEIRNPRDTSEMITSYFFTNGSSSKNTDTITVPVQTVALNSTTFIAYFDKLGEADLITGVTFTDRMMNENLLDQVAANKTIELTSGGELDFEKVLSLSPDVFMAYSYGESDFSRIENQGIPVVLNMEYLEGHPLGRTEWIKLAGILTGKGALADSIYQDIESQYIALKEKVSEATTSPSVFTGSRYNEIWYAPGRDSYIANYITDAGGNYVFENLQGAGSHEIDYEAALKAISDADYWGMITSHREPFTMQTVLKMDKFYVSFKAFRDKNIFVCNAAKTDYFGDAVMEPEILLADMIAIIHPEVLPDHQGKYFNKVE